MVELKAPSLDARSEAAPPRGGRLLVLFEPSQGGQGRRSSHEDRPAPRPGAYAGWTVMPGWAPVIGIGPAQRG
jgi:hypothetical protein